LQQRLYQMDLVHHEEHVVAEQAGVDRGRPGADAVAAEQQPGARLIHGGDNDGGPQGVGHPVALDGDAAAQGDHRGALCGFQGRAEVAGVLGDTVHHQAAVDHVHQPSGNGETL
jgi:hypothetical protein